MLEARAGVVHDRVQLRWAEFGPDGIGGQSDGFAGRNVYLDIFDEMIDARPAAPSPVDDEADGLFALGLRSRSEEDLAPPFSDQPAAKSKTDAGVAASDEYMLHSGTVPSEE